MNVGSLDIAALIANKKKLIENIEESNEVLRKKIGEKEHIHDLEKKISICHDLSEKLLETDVYNDKMKKTIDERKKRLKLLLIAQNNPEALKKKCDRLISMISYKKWQINELQVALDNCNRVQEKFFEDQLQIVDEGNLKNQIAEIQLLNSELSSKINGMNDNSFKSRTIYFQELFLKEQASSSVFRRQLLELAMISKKEIESLEAS